MKLGRQTGSQDCGLFVIAFMTSLAHGQNPTDVKYLQEEMRIHLVKCIESQEMISFPTSFKRKLKNKIHKIEKINIYCYCRLPDNGSKMFCCDQCNEWFHESCIGHESSSNPANAWSVADLEKCDWVGTGKRGYVG